MPSFLLYFTEALTWQSRTFVNVNINSVMRINKRLVAKDDMP